MLRHTDCHRYHIAKAGDFKMQVSGNGTCLEQKRDGAGDGIRTRDINLGKVALYQLSYSRAGKHCYCRAVAGSLSKYQGPLADDSADWPLSRNGGCPKRS